MPTPLQAQIAASASTQRQPKHNEKSHELLTCSARTPPFSYAHLEIATSGPDQSMSEVDMLQVKSYCTAALEQFLGSTGAAISVDILKVQGNECWLRVPQPDLGAFAAAVTAWSGTRNGDERVFLRVLQCSDWLGTMVGGDGQEKLWG